MDPMADPLLLLILLLGVGGIGIWAVIKMRVLGAELSEILRLESNLQLENADLRMALVSSEVSENAYRERASDVDAKMDSVRNRLNESRESATARIAVLEESENILSHEVAKLSITLDEITAEAKHQKGRAQSAHTAKGQLVEKWAPFVDHPELDPNWRPEDWAFLGNPIDYIVFDWRRKVEENLEEGKVYILEVKSAESRLSTKQRRIRDLVKAGKVEWREIRLD